MIKKQRGGKRPGAGTLSKEPGIKRVHLTAMVHPDTLKILDRERGRAGLSRGELLDKVFKLFNPPSYLH